MGLFSADTGEGRPRRLAVALAGLVVALSLSVVAPLPAGASLSGLRASLGSLGRSHGRAQDAPVWQSRFDATRACVFTDIGCGPQSDLVRAYSRMRDMADAYLTSGDPLFGNPVLRSQLVAGMDALDATYDARPKGVQREHWALEYGIPMALLETTAMLWDVLSPVQRGRYGTTVLEHIERQHTDTGANRAWVARTRVMAGVVLQNAAVVAEGREELVATLVFTRGQGFHDDGTYVFHARAHPGGYGISHLLTMAEMIQFLNGTAWQLAPAHIQFLVDRVFDTYEPFVWRSVVFEGVRAREITVKSDASAGLQFIDSVAKLERFASAESRARLQSMIKHHVLSSGFPLTHFNSRAVTIARDPAVEARSSYDLMQVFPDADRAVVHQNGHAIEAAMHSARRKGWESLDGNNVEGWYVPEGALYLHTADNTQFTSDFWPTVDRHRLPGTTVSTKRRTKARLGTDNPDPVDMNTEHWVGGVSIDDIGTAGMSLAYGPGAAVDTRFKKSYFFLDDEVVAVGSGIASDLVGEHVETIIENRRIAATETFTVHGAAGSHVFSSDATAPTSSANVDWAYLDGNEDVGYVFPRPVALSTIRGSRTGKWGDVDAGRTSEPAVTRKYQTAWIDHGERPTNGGYQYILLPDRSQAAVVAYADLPDVEVLADTNEVHSVRDRTAGLELAHFWTGVTPGVGSIASDHPAAVALQDTPNELKVAVSDPTQLNNGTIEIEIDRTATRLLAATDPGRVIVEQLAPTIRFTVDVSDARGRTNVITFSREGSPEPVTLVAPSGVRATSIGPHSFGVEWSAGDGAIGVDGYRVELDGQRVGAAVVDGTSLLIAADGLGNPLSPATAYEVRVRAVGGGQIGPPSEVLVVTTAQASPSEAGPSFVSTVGDRSDDVGQAVALSVAAVDPDGGQIAYAATGLPPGVALDTATGQITGAPTTPGSGPVTITATDDEGATATFTFTWTIADDTTPGPKRILIVAGTSGPPSRDTAIRDLLQAAGHQVTIVDDDALTPATATAHDVVFITSSVTPTTVGTTLRDSSTPVVVGEAYLFDDMSLAPQGQVGEASGTTMNITQPGHPATGGLTGLVNTQTTDGLGWANPVPAAQRIAAIPGSPRATLFTLDRGDQRANGTPSPARRAGIFLTWNATHTLTNAGKTLLTSTIDWASNG